MRPFVRSYGRHFQCDLIARKDADEIHAQLAGDVSQDHMPVRELYLERRVRQSFLYDSFYFNYVLLWTYVSHQSLHLNVTLCALCML